MKKVSLQKATEKLWKLVKSKGINFCSLKVEVICSSFHDKPEYSLKYEAYVANHGLFESNTLDELFIMIEKVLNVEIELKEDILI